MEWSKTLHLISAISGIGGQRRTIATTGLNSFWNWCFGSSKYRKIKSL